MLGIASAGATTLNYNGMIQTYSVLDTGTYDIIADGAQGGTSGPGSIGGLGAVGGGDISLNAGTTLYVVVGGRGGSGIGLGAGGGGGMSAVYTVTSGIATPLLVSGGGGGASGGPGVTTAGQSADGGPSGDGSGGSGGDGGGGAGFGTPPDYTVGNGGTGRPSGAQGGQGYGVFAGGSGWMTEAPQLGGTGGFGGGGGGGFIGGGGGGGYSGGEGGEGRGLAGTSNISSTFFDVTAFATLTQTEQDAFNGNGQVAITEIASAVPEPGSLLLLATALSGFAAVRRRRRPIPWRVTIALPWQPVAWTRNLLLAFWRAAPPP